MKHLLRINTGKTLMILLWCMPIITEAETNSHEEVCRSPFWAVDKENNFYPFVVVETWATLSIKEANYATSQIGRTDVSVRRLRFGASGAPYSWLKYTFHFHYDRLGADPYAATRGGENGLGIWNAYLSAKLLKNSELLNLHAGYFWAGISREYITAPWSVGSFDKTRAVWYLRTFLTGTGNGIESGVGLGGLKNFDGFGIGYRLGIHEPKLYAGSEFGSRLYSGRLMVSVGEAEQNAYTYMLSGNAWRARKGITLGAGIASQSQGRLTDSTVFGSSWVLGVDILIDYKGLRIDGEYFSMHRSLARYITAESRNRPVNSSAFDGTEWHIRIGYSFILMNKYIEPVISYDSYRGQGAKAVFKYIGDDSTLDFGVNWYLNNDKLKLSMHYVMQHGSIKGDMGNYAGLAFQLRL